MIVMKHRFPSGVLSSETPRDNQSLLGLLHGEPSKPERSLRNIPRVHFGHHDSSTLASSSWSKERAGATSGLPHQCSGAKENIGRLPTSGIRRKKTPVGKRLSGSPIESLHALHGRT